jgi:acyl-CoA synthetase (AMP-forming)/AMP-acid ligase II
MGTAGTLAELVADVATTDPDKPAIIFGDQSISYAQLNAEIERAADGLAACGVRPGDRVALMVPNCPEFAIAYYAILRLGAIAVPVNVLYKVAEIAHVLGDSAARALVVCAGFYAHAASAIEQTLSVQDRTSSSWGRNRLRQARRRGGCSSRGRRRPARPPPCGRTTSPSFAIRRGRPGAPKARC